LVVAVIAAVVAIAITLSDDTPSTTSLSAIQIAAIQKTCLQWSGGSAASPVSGGTSAGTACRSMTGWMDEQLHSGHMNGPVMWGNPTALGATCRQWMAAGPGSGETSSSAWCDQMVAWMTQHVGNWDNWMMNGQMMR
jgi:hypothetical protein